MTDEELREAIRDADNNMDSLSLLPSKGPFPQKEARHREMILLRQIAPDKIEDARKRNGKDLGRFNIETYSLMISFLKS